MASLSRFSGAEGPRHRGGSNRFLHANPLRCQPRAEDTLSDLRRPSRPLGRCGSPSRRFELARPLPRPTAVAVLTSGRASWVPRLHAFLRRHVVGEVPRPDRRRRRRGVLEQLRAQLEPAMRRGGGKGEAASLSRHPAASESTRVMSPVVWGPGVAAPRPRPPCGRDGCGSGVRDLSSPSLPGSRGHGGSRKLQAVLCKSVGQQ